MVYLKDLQSTVLGIAQYHPKFWVESCVVNRRYNDYIPNTSTKTLKKQHIASVDVSGLVSPLLFHLGGHGYFLNTLVN